MTVTDERRACPGCGHPAYMHREMIVTARTRIGDPVPCWCDHCGCTRRPR